MPIYGYRCRSCGHEFEILQKMSDSPLQTCPKCAGQLSKMVYPAGIVYKGTGYYSTDYKSGSKGQEKAASNGTSKTGSEGAGEGKAATESSESRKESKAEPKPESKASEPSSNS